MKCGLLQDERGQCLAELERERNDHTPSRTLSHKPLSHFCISAAAPLAHGEEFEEFVSYPTLSDQSEYSYHGYGNLKSGFLVVGMVTEA